MFTSRGLDVSEVLDQLTEHLRELTDRIAKQLQEAGLSMETIGSDGNSKEGNRCHSKRLER